MVEASCLRDKDCDGPASVDGVGLSASEEHEYVCVCGVWTHVESVGSGTLDDVHYTIVLLDDGVGVVVVTCYLSCDVGSLLDVAVHTNVYVILMLSGDAVEMCVTCSVPGVYVDWSTASLIKLAIGYSSGVVGGAEVTPIASVTYCGAALLIVNSDEVGEGRDSDHALKSVCECVTDAVSLNLPGPGGINVSSAPCWTRVGSLDGVVVVCF